MSVEPIVTVADLDAMPDDNNRYEVIDGELFMSKSPGIPLQRALRNLISLFSNSLRSWATFGLNDIIRSTILAGFDQPVSAIFCFSDSFRSELMIKRFLPAG